MITAKLVPPVPLEPTVQIELPRRQAVILRALVGGCGTCNEGEAKSFVWDVFNALKGVLDDDEEENTFSDFFDGRPICR